MTRIFCMISLLLSLLLPAGVLAWSDVEEPRLSPVLDWRCLVVTAASDEEQSKEPAESESEEPDCE